VTQDHFEKLLSRLHANRELAGSEYNLLRQKLINYFRLKGHGAPEDGADETLDRVAAKIAAEEEISDVTNYSFGVARYICLEDQREQTRRQRLGEQLSFLQAVSEPVDERLFNLMERCFNRLAPADRDLLQKYCAAEKGSLSNWRDEIAVQMNVSLGNLRLRIHRLRSKLEGCFRTGRQLLNQ